MEYFCYKCGSPLNEYGKCPQCDKNFYCYKCGEKLNEMGKCPKCDTVPREQSEPQPQAQETDNSNVQQPQPVENYQKKPSVFVETFKQVWNLICNFFSRNTLDAVSEQYKETLPIWAVIFAIPVLATAIYTGVIYGNISLSIEKLIHIDISRIFSPFEVAVIALIMAGISIAAYVFSVYFFSKIQKKPFTLKNSANLVAGAFIPVALCSVATLMLGIFGNGLGSVFSTLGGFAFIILLGESLRKAHNLERPYFWRLLAVYGAACVATAIVLCIILIPLVFIKALFLVNINDIIYSAYSLR